FWFSALTGDSARNLLLDKISIEKLLLFSSWWAYIFYLSNRYKYYLLPEPESLLLHAFRYDGYLLVLNISKPVCLFRHLLYLMLLSPRYSLLSTRSKIH